MTYSSYGMVCHQEPSLPELRHSFSKILGILELIVHAVTQSCLTLCGPMDYSPARLLCPWNFPGKYTGVGAFPTSGDLPNPGIEPKSLASPALAGRFFTTEPSGKSDGNTRPPYLFPEKSVCRSRNNR